MIAPMKSKRTTSKRSGTSIKSARAQLHKLIAEQHVKPAYDLDKIGAPLTVEPDPDAMIRFLEEERKARRAAIQRPRKRSA